MHRRHKALFCCAALALTVWQPARAQMPEPAQPPVPATVVRWVRARSTPFTTPAQLANVISNARVIGLGETEHGTEEFLSLRNRVVRYAVTSLDVTAIAAETGYNESIVADDYINGVGALTPSVIASVFSWSTPQAYLQNEALLQWLRDYNAHAPAKHKVHFYGIDLTGGRSGAFTEARASIDYALKYLEVLDPADGASYHARLDTLLPKFNTASYETLGAEQQTAITAAIADVIALFERRAVVRSARTSGDAFERAEHSAIVARDLNENFRSAQAESNPQAQREPAMAQNLQWVLQQRGSRRVLLYEANWHISKGPMASDRWGSGLGEYLQHALGGDYVAIATTFGSKAAAPDAPAKQADPSSLAAAFAGTCAAACLLDLRTPMPRAVASWFAGLHHIESGRVDIVNLRSSFDAMIYFPQVRSAVEAGPSA